MRVAKGRGSQILEKFSHHVYKKENFKSLFLYRGLPGNLKFTIHIYFRRQITLTFL